MENMGCEGMFFDNELHEECGVIGALDLEGKDVATALYFGLSALQHRGQQSCGIAVTDTKGPADEVKRLRDMGLVNEVFDEPKISELTGNLGIGHVRYSAEKESIRENTQPLVINYVKGSLGLAENGTIINVSALKKELARTGAIFQTTIDAEVLAYLIARERLNTDSIEAAVREACKKLKGAFSLVIMSPQKLIGVRDPLGFRPLCIGKRDNTYFLASETCALDAVDAEFIRDVEPGEVVTITSDGQILSDNLPKEEKKSHCIFEYVYFARPDSTIDGVSVYDSRIMAGRVLAQECPVEADLVTGVPDSGTVAALGYAMESGIPYGMAFVKNSYVGRTFIKPQQSMRESSVKIKLNVIRDAVKGKRIIMIDDSIVRGTTSANIVKMLKAAGAKEVHVRISSPEFLYPCYFGTDIPSTDQLIACHHTNDEICKMIGADSLGFMNLNRLSELVHDKLDFCDACFTGKYPVKPEE